MYNLNSVHSNHTNTNATPSGTKQNGCTSITTATTSTTDTFNAWSKTSLVYYLWKPKTFSLPEVQIMPLYHIHIRRRVCHCSRASLPKPNSNVVKELRMETSKAFICSPNSKISKEEARALEKHRKD